MSQIGAQNLRISNNKGLQVVDGRDLGLKVNSATFETDANGLGLKDGSIAPTHLNGELGALLNVGLKRATWVTVASSHNLLATQQPATLPESYFVGKQAGGGVNGNGVLGVVAGTFASALAETGIDAGQAGLGATPASDRPYPSADFAGQRGIFVVLQKKDGDDVLLADLLSTADGPDTNARVFGYLSHRSDLAANSQWRLWLHYTRAADGLEVPFIPDLAINNVSIHVAEVFGVADLPVRSGLGLVSPAGQAAAAVGPKSIGSVELDDAAVVAAKLATNSVTSSALANGAVTESKLNDASVSGAKLQDGAVGAGKLATDAVTEAKLAANSVTSAKLKLKRRFEKVVGNAASGATLTLSRAIAAGREEGVLVTEDGAFIDYVASGPGASPKEFTASGTSITLGFTQVQDAIYRLWFESEAP